MQSSGATLTLYIFLLLAIGKTTITFHDRWCLLEGDENSASDQEDGEDGGLHAEGQSVDDVGGSTWGGTIIN